LRPSPRLPPVTMAIFPLEDTAFSVGITTPGWYVSSIQGTFNLA
jgi:hypothetical protein